MPLLAEPLVWERMNAGEEWIRAAYELKGWKRSRMRQDCKDLLSALHPMADFGARRSGVRPDGSTDRRTLFRPGRDPHGSTFCMACAEWISMRHRQAESKLWGTLRLIQRRS